jgi:hypothetical protein
MASVRLTCRPIERGLQCQLLALSRDVSQAPRDVTREASWHLSGVAGAQVSTAGIVEATHEGDVEINVDYQSQTTHCLVRLTPRAPGQLLAIVRGHAFVEDDESLRPVSGVRVEVVSGPDIGKSATTGRDGAFALAGLLPGTFDLRATKNGDPPTELPVSAEPGETRTNLLMQAPRPSDDTLRLGRLAGRSPWERKRPPALGRLRLEGAPAWSSVEMRTDDPFAD